MKNFGEKTAINDTKEEKKNRNKKNEQKSIYI